MNNKRLDDEFVPHDFERWLDAEKQRPSPTMEAREQVYQRLSVTLGFFPNGSGGGDVTSASSPMEIASTASVKGSAVSLLTHKIVIWGGLVAASITGIVYVGVKQSSNLPVPAHPPTVSRALRESPTNPITAQQETPSSMNATSATTASNSSLKSPSESTTSLPTKKSRKTKSVSSNDDDTQALQRLEHARHVLTQGEAKHAITLLHQHEAQFPQSAVNEEREVLIIMALTKLNQFSSAQDRAKRFMQRYPQSLFGPTIKQLLSDAIR